MVSSVIFNILCFYVEYLFRIVGKSCWRMIVFCLDMVVAIGRLHILLPAIAHLLGNLVFSIYIAMFIESEFRLFLNSLSVILTGPRLL